MIQPGVLLTDLKRLLPKLETDLRARTTFDADIAAALRGQHAAEQKAQRTGEAYEVWRDAWVTQAAVAWLLSLVFVRYLEDNEFVPPRLAGNGDRGREADEQRQLYIRAFPTHSDARYLQHVVFDQMGALPGARGLFGQHNLARTIAPSGDLATDLLTFFARQRGGGQLAHDFGGMRGDTRFLGDLYQDLSQEARERYALLQTPDFVESFILDHTLEPALATFGLNGLRVIDPTCGSGHFLLGAFGRLIDRWRREAPGLPVEDLVQRALDSVWGVDLNPFAVAIARFRLLLVALEVCGVRALSDAHAFTLNLTVADSLLAAPTQLNFMAELGDPLYSAEDSEAIRRTFGQRYHAVVGNPPYITVKDKVLNAEYRMRYKGSCHGKYSMSAPFTEQLFGLALPAGFVGTITASSFMKREFGKGLIEQVLPHIDLTHVVDTSGAYIPGHGTPTVILFGRNQRQVAETVRAVQGIRGEPTTPAEPAQGLVWQSIQRHVANVGFQNEYVSVVDVPLDIIRRHPWSIQGGGASDHKLTMELSASTHLGGVADQIGVVSVTLQDEIYIPGRNLLVRSAIGDESIRPMVLGEGIRDWGPPVGIGALFPYDVDLKPKATAAMLRFLWRWRSLLKANLLFGQTKEERGMQWWEHGMLTIPKLRTPLSIAFAFVATHNHFILDRDGKIFNRSAPVIKLPIGTTEDDHLVLLGLLNSSAACFWMKQVSHSNSGSGVGRGIQPESWMERYQFDGSKLLQFPVPKIPPVFAELARSLDAGAAAIRVRESLAGIGNNSAESRQADLCALIATQEELDWHVYRAYHLSGDDSLTFDGTPPPIYPGERAFEIALARAVAAGDSTTAWFERHGAAPTLAVPVHWPAEYRAVVQRRLAAIERDPALRLLEQPEYKRRWSTEPFAALVARNTYGWLLDRLEEPAYRDHSETNGLVNTTHISAIAARDPEFLSVAGVYAGREDFDLLSLVTDLVLAESAPALPPLLFTETGLRLRAMWEQVWDLQRREDDGETVEIPVLPKYSPADFRDAVYWRMRGKLDVPKERFNLYPYAGRPGDRGIWVTWAGLNHLQRARAVAGAYTERKDQDGWSAEQLTPFLAELDQLVPWLKQWHNDPDPDFDGTKMGDYYAEFTIGQIHGLGLKLEDVRAWAPAATRRKSGRAQSGG